MFFWLDLTDVTLADEDTNSILTEKANRAIQGIVAIQVTSWVNCNQCKWRHQVAKFPINANGAIWWLNLEQMQMTPPGGQIWN